MRQFWQAVAVVVVGLAIVGCNSEKDKMKGDKTMTNKTDGDKMKDDVKAGMMNLVQTRMPFAPKDVTEDFEQSLDKMDIKPAIIAAYKQHLSVEDADALIAFAKTPAGKEVIEMLPELMQQQEQAAVTQGRKTAQEVVERHRPEIDAAARQYRAEHAPKPAPSLNSPAPGAAPAAPATQPPTPTPPPQQ